MKIYFLQKFRRSDVLDVSRLRFIDAYNKAYVSSPECSLLSSDIFFESPRQISPKIISINFEKKIPSVGFDFHPADLACNKSD
jgi:hypothetical protein